MESRENLDQFKEDDPILNGRKLALILTSIIVLAGLLAIPRETPQAHAATVGVICISDDRAINPATISKCPIPPEPVLTGPATTPGTQLRVFVAINNSMPLNGFDIIVRADHRILKPADVDLTFPNTVLIGTPIVVLKCIGGVRPGTVPCPSQDNADTIHLAATNALGTGTTSNPTSGPLFAAIFNITGTTAPAGITIDFQTGCTTTPTSVPPDTCIGISDGTTTPVPETAQSGSFNNNTPPPHITITASSTVIGPILPGGFSATTITATSQNGFNTTTLTTVSLTSVNTPATGLTASLNPNPLDLTSVPSASSTLTITTTAATPTGNFFITAYATYTVEDPVTLVNSTLSAAITLQIQVVDFTITASPTTVGPLVPGTPGTATITISPINGFTGTVTLTTVNVSPGLTATLNPTSVSGGSGASTLTVTASAQGTYTLQARGTSGTRARTTSTITVPVNLVHDVAIQSFTTSATTGTVGTSITFTVNVQNKGTVQETVTVNALVGAVTVASKNVTLAPGASQPVQLAWDTTGYTPGSYPLGAKVLQVSGETSTTDNTLASGTFTLQAAPTSPLSQNLLIILAVIAIIVIVAIILLWRRSARASTPT